MSISRAWVVVDLGFGDAGKGTTVDYLTHAHDARWVVRFNGGAQAGHNVVTPDGRHHTFCQFGAGMFAPEVRTHLARWTVLDPLSLQLEAQRLEQLGVKAPMERLSIAPQARIITPYHRALNRLRELSRGARAHGTCGVGFGETVHDSLKHPELTIRAADLLRPARLMRMLRKVQAHAQQKARRLAAIDTPEAKAERTLLDDPQLPQRWLEGLAPLHRYPLLQDDADVPLSGPVIFEGAQGVLLDEWLGFHPFTTWSTCTPANARTMLKSRGFSGPLQTLGVLRSYTTRHGAGPLPTETASLAPELQNSDKGWQGSFRQGWLDLVLMRYALEVCPVDALVLTHLDRVRPGWKYCSAYEAPFERPRPGVPCDLQHQRELGQALFRAKPILHQAPDAARFVDWLQDELRTPIAVTSRGPRRDQKSIIEERPALSQRRLR